jgi:ABC-type transport system substrate-binding protein
MTNVTPDMWDSLITQAGSICGRTFGDEFKQFLINNSLVDVADIFNEPERLTANKGTEAEVTQNISVFKRNFKRFIMSFDDKFVKLTDDAAKADLINMALNYLYVVDTVFGIEASTATNLFAPIATKEVSNDLKIALSIISKFLTEQGNPKGVKYVRDLIQKLMDEVGGNINELMGKTSAAPTSFVTTSDEEEETGDVVEVDPKNEPKINSVLKNFLTGNIIEFI